jgi:hypothetical protein
MRKAILSIVALAAMVSWDCATQRAGADGVQVVHHARKVHHAYRADCVGSDRCGAPVGGPSRYSCYSPYGAYGPYGGAALPTAAGFGRGAGRNVAQVGQGRPDLTRLRPTR